MDALLEEPVVVVEHARHAQRWPRLGRAREIEGLHEALATRKLIGQGIGIVMERFGLDEGRAFEFLLRTSQQSNVKLRRVAEDLVTEVQRPLGSPPEG